MNPIFTDIPIHIAMVKSLEDVAKNIAAVDNIEDDEVAEGTFIKIALVAEAAIDYFLYVRAQALKGAENRAEFIIDAEAEADANAARLT
jgi:hypothetical protein